MSPSLIGVSCVVAGTAYFAVRHLLLWLGSRQQRLHLWVAAWSAGSLVAASGRLLQYAAEDANTAVLGMRMSTSAAFLLGVVVVGAYRSLVSQQRGSKPLNWLAVAAVLLTAMCWATDLFVTTSARRWTDALGQTYWWVDPGPLLPLLAVWGVSLLGYAIHLLRRSKRRTIGTRLLLGASVVYVLVGLNDLLIAAGLLHSVILFEYGFVILAAALDTISVRRIHCMYAGLQHTVSSRTAKLQLANTKLARALEMASEAALAKDAFLANMSHEIRTPMNGVIGTAELLAETELDVSQRDYVETLRESGDALLVIVNDVLDFSKIRAGRVQLECVEFELWGHVEEVVQLMAKRAHAKGIELTLCIDDDVPRRMLGDPFRYRQVLTNLLSNAIKFTAAGEVCVRLSMAEPTTDGQLIRCEVQDTGIGLDAEEANVMFAPFAQADTSTTRQYGGTGLGLAICAELVKLMRGTIEVDSVRGQGATFAFTAALQGIGVRIRPSTFHTSANVLIIAERASVADMLRYQLVSIGARPTVATSIPAAIEIARSAGLTSKNTYAFIDDATIGDDAVTRLKEALHPSAKVHLLEPVGAARTSKPAGIDRILTKPTRRARIADAVGAATESVPRPSQRGIVRGHVLLAEDNRVNQLVASKLLGNIGLEVDVVDDGLRALRAAEERRYDMIFMDCQMPSLDGYEATRRLRASDGLNSYTPIIALTASARPEDHRRCLEAGMDGFVSKPVKLPTMRRIVGQWMNASSDRAERSGRAREHGVGDVA